MALLYLALIASTPVLFLGKDIEERFFPVVENTRLLRVESDGPKAVLVWISFDKTRNCQLIDIAWYKVDGFTGGLQRVDFKIIEDFGGPPVTRPEGVQVSGPWRIEVSPQTFTEGIVSHVNHRCHPLWTTQTVFYPN
jgi:hypothetical protein